MSSTPPPIESGHRLAEHTGEVELQIWASDLGQLFAEAGRAIGELMLEEVEEVVESSVELSVEATERTELLFEWINELIYHSEMDKVVFVDFSVREISDIHLVAEAQAVRPRRLRTAVKAATFHELSVVDTPDGVSATVVLDV